MKLKLYVLRKRLCIFTHNLKDSGPAGDIFINKTNY